MLKDRGELVFDAPAVHMFDIGRFREETMAFPPGVTVKDYTWGGKGGYLNPIRGGQPARFPTIIQIVPATAARRSVSTRRTSDSTPQLDAGCGRTRRCDRKAPSTAP